MQKNEVPFDEYQRIWALVYQTRDVMARAAASELREAGLTTVQAAVLFLVKAIGQPATPAELSRWLLRRPHSVSVLLNKMEQRGLVSRVKDLDKKNMVRVSLTERGEEAYRQALLLNRGIREILSSLSPEERSCFEGYLRTLRGTGVAVTRSKQPPYP